jgi:hypothetical protein
MSAIVDYPVAGVLCNGGRARDCAGDKPLLKPVVDRLRNWHWNRGVCRGSFPRLDPTPSAASGFLISLFRVSYSARRLPST